MTYMAHQYSRVGFKSSVEVNEVNLSLSYGGVASFLKFAVGTCDGVDYITSGASDTTKVYVPIGQFEFQYEFHWKLSLRECSEIL